MQDRQWLEPWYLYYIVAQNTMRTYGVPSTKADLFSEFWEPLLQHDPAVAQSRTHEHRHHRKEDDQSQTRWTYWQYCMPKKS